MPTIEFQLNGSQQRITNADPEMPLLWVLRDSLGLVGTKYGCGIAQCGACTVHLNGQPARACSLPLSGVEGQSITTIEGLAPGGELHALQQAWLEMDVPQCGYCQAGQLMTAAALLAGNKHPSDDDIDRAMVGNLCRCGTYPRIRAAIHQVAGAVTGEPA